MTCRTVTRSRTAPTPTAHSGSPNIIPLLQNEPVSRASTTVRTHTSPRSASVKRLLGGASSDQEAEPELQRLVRRVDTHGAAFEDLPQLGAWRTQDLARGGTDLEKRGHQRAEIRE